MPSAAKRMLEITMCDTPRELSFHESKLSTLDRRACPTFRCRPGIAVLTAVLIICLLTVDGQECESYWSGTAPFCAGACDVGWTSIQTSGCGDGACCWSGQKHLCQKCEGPFIEEDVDLDSFNRSNGDTSDDPVYGTKQGKSLGHKRNDALDFYLLHLNQLRVSNVTSTTPCEFFCQNLFNMEKALCQFTPRGGSGSCVRIAVRQYQNCLRNCKNDPWNTIPVELRGAFWNIPPKPSDWDILSLWTISYKTRCWLSQLNLHRVIRLDVRQTTMQSL